MLSYGKPANLVLLELLGLSTCVYDTFRYQGEKHTLKISPKAATGHPRESFSNFRCFHSLQCGALYMP